MSWRPRLCFHYCSPSLCLYPSLEVLCTMTFWGPGLTVGPSSLILAPSSCQRSVDSHTGVSQTQRWWTCCFLLKSACPSLAFLCSQVVGVKQWGGPFWAECFCWISVRVRGSWVLCTYPESSPMWDRWPALERHFNTWMNNKGRALHWTWTYVTPVGEDSCWVKIFISTRNHIVVRILSVRMMMWPHVWRAVLSMS